MNTLDNAKALAALGFSIIPVPRGSKKPVIGWKDYQTKRADDEQIEKWFDNSQPSNIAIITGQVSGLVVVDGDSDEAQRWIKANLPQTPLRVKTQKGVHYYYRHPGGEISNKVKIAREGGKLDIDIRGDGGYVIAPGSKHPDGFIYKSCETFFNHSSLNGMPLFDPAWSEPPPPPVLPLLNTGALERARSYLAKVPGAIEGCGGDVQTFKTACHAVRGFGLSEDEAFEVMREWNVKCSPPWTEWALKEKIRNAYKYGSGSIGSKIDAARIPQERPHQPPEAIRIEPIELATLPEPGPRVDIVAGLLPENQVTILYGDGGQGKSFLALSLAFAIATGTPFLGVETNERPVLYLDWELDHLEHGRRAYQIARGSGLNAPPKGVHYWRAEQPLPAIIDGLAALVKRENFGVVILDSLGAACGGDPELARSVIPLLSSLRALNTSVLALDHQSKLQEGQNADKKTIFGSVYKFNLARSVIHLRKADSREGELSLLLTPKKYNLGALGGDIPAKIYFEGAKVRIERGDLADPKFFETLSPDKKILSFLEDEGASTKEEIAESTGIPAGSVKNALTKLKRDGKVSEAGKKGHKPQYVANGTTARPYSVCRCADGDSPDDERLAIMGEGLSADEIAASLNAKILS